MSVPVQAMAESWLACVGTGPVVELLAKVAQLGDSAEQTAPAARAEAKKAESFLLNLVQAILKSLEALQLPQSMPADALPMEDAIERVKGWCRCIISLVSPIPGHMGSSVEAVETVLKDSTYAYMFIELKDQLKSSPYWAGLLQRARESAAADVEYKAQIAELANAMKSAENVVQRVAAVKAAMEARVSMQRNLRPGALEQLEAEASSQLQHIAEKIVGTDAAGDDGVVLAIDCDWLVNAMTTLAPPAASGGQVAELIIALKECRSKNAATLAVRELKELVQRFQPEEDDAEPKVDWTHFACGDALRIVESLRDSGSLESNSRSLEDLLVVMLDFLGSKAHESFWFS